MAGADSPSLGALLGGAALIETKKVMPVAKLTIMPQFNQLRGNVGIMTGFWSFFAQGCWPMGLAAMRRWHDNGRDDLRSGAHLEWEENNQMAR